MFKFNFTAADGASTENKSVDEYCGSNDEDNLEWAKAEEILCQDGNSELYENWGELQVNNHLLYFLLQTSNNLMEEESPDLSRDIIPSKYEGGLKIWDCTHHLLRLMNEYLPVDYFKNKTVLDLGCGNGLLGIVSFLLGATTVHFQDYNESVIRRATIPNVLKNLKEVEHQVECKYYSGDWSSFKDINLYKYDIILTSATIYNVKNYRKLLAVFRNNLKEEGIVLLGAKTYYFGNGGGTRQFEEVLIKDGSFKSKVLWMSSEGVQQEILQVTYKGT